MKSWYWLILIISSLALAQTDCPEYVPVELDKIHIMACDQEINPNRLDTNGCSYSDYEINRNVLCGCLNYTALGLINTIPEIYWGCIHSQSQCPQDAVIGSECGVKYDDLKNSNFLSSYPVSGPDGCMIGSQSYCYCLPPQSSGSWIWQCFNQNPFNNHLEVSYNLTSAASRLTNWLSYLI